MHSNQLKSLRCGESQMRVAKASGVPRCRLSAAENGDATLSPAEIERIRSAVLTLLTLRVERAHKALLGGER